MMRISKALTALFMTLSLAACGVNQNPLEVQIQRCPAVAVVDEADTWVAFAGDEKNSDDVVFDALLSNVSLECSQGSTVESRVSFDVSVRGGPALDSPQMVTVPYFVVLLKDNSVVVAKKTYEVTFEIGPESPRAGSRETIVQMIDDIERTRRYDYELLIGFDMDKAAVAYNALR